MAVPTQENQPQQGNLHRYNTIGAARNMRAKDLQIKKVRGYSIGIAFFAFFTGLGLLLYGKLIIGVYLNNKLFEYILYVYLGLFGLIIIIIIMLGILTL